MRNGILDKKIGAILDKRVEKATMLAKTCRFRTAFQRPEKSVGRNGAEIDVFDLCADCARSL